MSDKPVVLDLDAVKHDRRVVKLAGREIDVTVIPFGIMLDILKNLPAFGKLGSDPAKAGEENPDALVGLMDVLYETTVKVCGHKDRAITREWLEQNADVLQMIRLMQFVVAPLMQKVDDAKNLFAAGVGER